MKILVTYGSQRGGTEGLARMVAEALHDQGMNVDLMAPSEVRSVNDYDAVIVGGALYAYRWHKDARRFVRRHAKALRGRPTYLFSSGPLDDSASVKEIEPVKGVRTLMRSIGARGHSTFGGRLEVDAKGFPASAMAKKSAGDWRRAEDVNKWVASIVAQLRGTTADA